ncbi:E3 ubiquitin-protein ligase RNF25 isoform X2 [Drosophila sechellia]|uniref:GM21499 n=1 Tax=Drosophila sechellia TaxID=7238 RepID=B4HQY2_DROSE|nr:E3 ubiquitin-protein ligase RNF25 isoform X2 [Drosophila sechellia]EDW47779.1 GM21499 [Drosophila sechellia]
MDALQDEVESLEAILMDDVCIKRTPNGEVEQIETTVLPLTGEEEEQQYVCVTLQVHPTPGYPEESPTFKLLRPRGLDDARLEAIRSACNAKIKESIGFPVVFDLIEVVREHLSGSNLPSGQCVVCLYGFADGDEFTRTECFHYLHSYCLARHLNALRRNYQEEFDKLPAWLQKTADPFQALCPVCREHIGDETDSLKCAMPPSELLNAPEFKVTEELRQMQQRMSELYLQQKSRGAIIDVNAEGSAVISIETEEDIRRRRRREETEAAKKLEGPAKEEVIKPTTSSTFAPVVQETHRIMPEPTNNNYQHNRRHYRGGRRHHHHHQHGHHHRAERDRGEQNPSATPATAGGSTSNTANTNSKQAKAQSASSGLAR